MTCRVRYLSAFFSVALPVVFVAGCTAVASQAPLGGFDWGRTGPHGRAVSEIALVPVEHITHEAIDESSGLIRYQGSYWTHNDSGDRPRLFRSTDLSFRHATALAVPGAEAIDWEDLATYRGDLLVCDTGDNRREREFVTLYQVRPLSSDRLSLVDTFHIGYPDGRHDAEACFSVGDTLYIVSKDRGEGTHVYRWVGLSARSKSVQIGERVGTLDLEPGQQITAADYEPSVNRVCLLSYSALVSYSLDRFFGRPEKEMRIWAQQVESLCLDGADLIFGNEQREIFRIPMDASSGPVAPSAALPPMVIARWPQETWQTLPLQSTLHGENVEWRRVTEGWEVRANIRFEDKLRRSNFDETKIGSGVCLSFAPELANMPVKTVGNETHLLVVRGEEGAELWRVWLGHPGDTELRAIRLGIWPDQIQDGRWSWTIVVPASEIEPLEEQGTSRFDVHGIRLRDGDGEIFLRAPGRYALERPYAWGRIE